MPELWRAGEVRMTFTESGPWAAKDAAEAWCANHGISVGFMQGQAPRGLLYGDFLISKWRNMSKREIAVLDGRMTGDMRNGPVVVEMYDKKVGPRQ